jgi:hypothetical protein
MRFATYRLNRILPKSELYKLKSYPDPVPM